ncbi:hypothetical protein Tola_1455 [Tolumonas auensis DSM 9187]|jgi:hypothetical protein|uniref:Uncharacterized protein n=1 Tax=Tolumonas auensis (strain DSM 9187 / NBRC 110442 / TA 4) TaxID=595494 RepID=C4LEQ3_TOLAT|nr:hypothetical protein Tola_1455 [Tolumonas auensis DSM 9187]
MKLRRKKIRQRHMWFSLWQYELSPVNQPNLMPVKVSER